MHQLQGWRPHRAREKKTGGACPIGASGRGREERNPSKVRCVLPCRLGIRRKATTGQTIKKRTFATIGCAPGTVVPGHDGNRCQTDGMIRARRSLATVLLVLAVAGCEVFAPAPTPTPTPRPTPAPTPVASAV